MAVTAAVTLLLGGCHIRNVPNEDPNDTLIDTDNDNIPNVKDDDIDNDGKINTQDDDIDGDGIVNTADPDIDGDGVANIDDNDIDGDGIINTEDRDIDGDGIINTEDPDIDGDGVLNIDDNDIDGDGILNTADDDIDGDGIVNGSDRDIDGDGIVNSDDVDIDGDGIVNSQDPDIDGDGIANEDDATPAGTGTESNGTQGASNTGSDTDTGVVNTGADANGGETDRDVYVEGVGVVAEDTVAFTLDIAPGQGAGTVTTKEVVDLAEVRSTVVEKDIDLSTFGVSNLAVKTAASSFVGANAKTRVVVNVSYLDDAGDKIPVLGSAGGNSARPVLTLADLAEGVNLNEQIFAADEGFGSFITMVKDETMDSVTAVIDITFIDAPQGSGALPVDLVVRAVGTKPL